VHGAGAAVLARRVSRSRPNETLIPAATVPLRRPLVGQNLGLVSPLWLVIPGAVSGLAALALASFALLRQRCLLAASLLGSLSALLVVSGWLLASPGVTQVNALKTGGLAGAAILALRGLWINDRRRRTDEARHELDRERVSDERFAKAVEPLGNEVDQVRVGALHVLAGLAHGRHSYTQTVLDVPCAYLLARLATRATRPTRRTPTVRMCSPPTTGGPRSTAPPIVNGRSGSPRSD